MRRLKDRDLIPWFRLVLKDDHFVVNSGCGLLREKFYPVRSLAEADLHDLGAEPLDEETLFVKRRETMATKALKSIERK